VKLIAYFTAPDRDFEVRPAKQERDWINKTPVRFAARCLPLLMANAHGWEILFKDSCEVTWNGGAGIDDLKVITASGSDIYVGSHFGSGILTFRVHCLFRTEPSINLWICGPVNVFKDGVQPLSAIVESDWMPYTFTVNWKVTRAHETIRFGKDDPICHIFPMPRSLVEDTQPEIQSLGSNPELLQSYGEWSSARRVFNERPRAKESEAVREKWQKHYFRGLSFPDIARRCRQWSL
jgi:hypothetical protein